MYPALRILIASGQDAAALRRRFAGRAAIGFLGKPYRIDDLRAELRALGVTV